MQVCTLGSLGDMQADMFTTVYVGNSMSVLSGGRMIAMRNQMQGGV
jgi:precorrin-3B C17-methyltransferase